MFRAYSLFWTNYFDFSGITSRQDYWLAYLINFILLILLIFNDGNFPFSNFIGFLFIVLVFIPSLAILIRRLRDVGKPWYYIFINYIPVVGTIWFTVLMATKSSSATL